MLAWNQLGSCLQIQRGWAFGCQIQLGDRYHLQIQRGWASLYQIHLDERYHLGVQSPWVLEQSSPWRWTRRARADRCQCCVSLRLPCSLELAW